MSKSDKEVMFAYPLGERCCEACHAQMRGERLRQPHVMWPAHPCCMRYERYTPRGFALPPVHERSFSDIGVVEGVQHAKN